MVRKSLWVERKEKKLDFGFGNLPLADNFAVRYTLIKKLLTPPNSIKPVPAAILGKKEAETTMGQG
ncbi:MULTISPECIES: hypothetical protein [unclassified Synechocystis]|uniref:hypothetical protein n=1 Tax=unclassified Synechocystis TaxID=2640012 RepID=UPI00048D44DC|nr:MULTISPECIES: hypothetical protein [unclassified Synechocystis]AIE75291.1 hypothetical protein D082_27630 [Synechocystis sp. PCC 6714]MCT0253031.1 hypothetical protein [Synechocystis sp. CS-94]